MEKETATPYDIAAMESTVAQLTRGFQWLGNCGSGDWAGVSEQLSPWLRVGSPAIEGLISAIRSTQNRFSGINRLPEELLGAIFEAVADSVLSDPDMRCNSGWTQVPMYRWLHINQVCRHWRRIALSRPALWTCVHFDRHQNPPTTNLQRSGILPLTGYFDTTDPVMDLLSYAEHIGRFRELYINIPWDGDHLPDAPSMSWTAKTPLLDILVVNNGWHPVTVGMHTSESQTSNWYLPHLRTLIWEGHFSMDSGKFGNLRHLVLVSVHISSLEHLLSVLATNISLEDLILEDFRFPRLDQASIDALPTMELSSLRLMHVKETVPFELFRILDRKLLTRSNIVRAFTHPPSVISDLPVISMGSNDRIYVDETRVIVWASNSALCFYDQDPPTGRPYVNSLHPHFSWFLQTIARSQPVRELWLSVRPLHGFPLEWMTFFAFLENVKRLVLVTDSPAESCLEVFTEHPTFLPSLTHLQLDMTSDWLRPTIPSIINFLLARTDARHPIRSLHIVKAKDDPEAANLTAEVFLPYVESVTIESVDSEDHREPLHVRMELPATFTTPSPVHSYWNGWAGPTTRSDSPEQERDNIW